MPFIRYRSGDVAKIQAGNCSCGRGFPLLQTVEGRTSDIIVGKNGMIYSCPGPRFFGTGIKGIYKMQLVQDCIDELIVNIVPDEKWNEDELEKLVARMRNLLGNIEVVVNLLDDISPSPSGKYPFSISKVSPFQ